MSSNTKQYYSKIYYIMTQKIVSEAWFSPDTSYSIVSILTQVLHIDTMTTVDVT